MTEALFTWNVIYLDAPIEKVWWATVHPEGMNAWLSDSARTTGDPDHPAVGDVFDLVYGSISNTARVVELIPGRRFVLDDTYISRFPDGNAITYPLRTTYEMTPTDDGIRYTVHTRGYADDTTGHWLVECMRTGWTKSLLNLKAVLEHGMDLRNQIFGYPRIGIHNMTVRSYQYEQTGAAEGNYLLRVFPGTPAERAGLRPGDVITRVGSVRTPTYHDLVRALGSHTADCTVEIEYTRNGRQGLRTTCRLTDDPVLAGFVNPPEQRPQ